MKKIIVFLTILVALVTFFVFNGEEANKEEVKSEDVLGEISEENIADVSFRDQTYKASYYEVSPVNLSLFSNFEDRLTAKEALEKRECEALVTGGFHSREDGPLGLFISGGNLISRARESTLLNGYFYAESDAAVISKEVPQSTPLALQTGPILFQNGSPVDVSAENSENARRVVVATTERDTVLFVVFYETDNYVKGPKLVEMPELVNLLSQDIGVGIDDAINLDGGAHSAFITPFITLPEISPIGSYFCIR